MYRTVNANPHWFVGIDPRKRPAARQPLVLNTARILDAIGVSRDQMRRAMQRKPLAHGKYGLPVRSGGRWYETGTPGANGSPGTVRFIPDAPRIGRGMGDVAKLTQAEQILRANGYNGATCRTEEVFNPGGGNYTQDVCSAPGFIGGMMVDAILQNRASGGGVDLAAQRKFDVDNGGQHEDAISYFNTIGQGSKVIVYGETGPSNQTYTGSEKTTNAGGGTAARAVTVTLENNTRPGGALRVGDNWTLKVSGSPNSPVTASATQNGRDMGTSNFGTTNAAGELTVKGTFDAGNVGAWVQTWKVNGMSGVLNFNVAAAASTSGSTGGNTNQGYTGTDKETGKDPATPGFDWEQEYFGLPVWMWGVGGLGAMWAFRGGR